MQESGVQVCRITFIISLILLILLEEYLEHNKEKHCRLDIIAGNSSDPLPTFDTAIPLEPEDILSGQIPLHISHAGGELLAILHDEEDSDDEELEPQCVTLSYTSENLLI